MTRVREGFRIELATAKPDCVCQCVEVKDEDKAKDECPCDCTCCACVLLGVIDVEEAWADQGRSLKPDVEALDVKVDEVRRLRKWLRDPCDKDPEQAGGNGDGDGGGEGGAVIG